MQAYVECPDQLAPESPKGGVANSLKAETSSRRFAQLYVRGLLLQQQKKYPAAHLGNRQHGCRSGHGAEVSVLPAGGLTSLYFFGGEPELHHAATHRSASMEWIDANIGQGSALAKIDMPDSKTHDLKEHSLNMNGILLCDAYRKEYGVLPPRLRSKLRKAREAQARAAAEAGDIGAESGGANPHICRHGHTLTHNGIVQHICNSIIVRVYVYCMHLLQ
jgi:hypothetical protein